MVICGECGTRNAPGTPFCTGCGAFLEWEGEQAEPAVASTAGTTAAGPGGPAAPVLTQPSANQPSANQPSANQPSANQPSANQPSANQPSADPTSSADAPAPADLTTPSDRRAVGEQGTSGAPRTSAAGRPDPPVPQPATGPRLVRPDEQRQRYHPVTREESDATGPVDVRCPHCGVGNAAARKFCRSCGGELAVPAVVARRSWWRRLLDRLATRRAHEAGTRRRMRGSHGWLRVLALLAVLLAAVGTAVTVLPTRRIVDQVVTATKDRLSDHVSVTPTEVKASTEARNAAARNISDGVSNRFWAPSGKPVGSWVEARLAPPVRLLEVVIVSGISTDKKAFLTQGRPRELTVTVTNRAGAKKDVAIVVKDEPGQQRFPVAVSDATTVRFTIRSTYGMPPGKLCAIGEIGLLIRG